MAGVQRVVLKLKDTAVTQDPSADSLPIEVILGNALIDRIKQQYPGRFRARRVFTSVPANRLRKLAEKAESAEYHPPNFNTFALLEIDGDAEVGPLGSILNAESNVTYWYRDPDGTSPSEVYWADDVDSSKQGYLDPAPGGLDVKALWNQTGSSGVGISFADVEQGWTLNHGQLIDPGTKSPRTTIIGSGVMAPFFLEQQHGTRVLGLIFAADDTKSVVGIAPNVAKPYVSSYVTVTDGNQLSQNRADAILAAVDQLDQDGGGVLLIEIQIIEKDFDPKDPADLPLVPVEACQAEFEIIRLATHNRVSPIVVVECAGNGGGDLDLFSQPDRRTLVRALNPNDDSGAIMVGGATHDVPHCATGSTNIGGRIDCYAWGEEVVTIGAPRENPFNGTSAAGALIAGACVSIQGIRKSAGQPMFRSSEMRALLSGPGTSVFPRSGNGTETPIGVMPDLSLVTAALLAAPGGPPVISVGPPAPPGPVTPVTAPVTPVSALSPDAPGSPSVPNIIEGETRMATVPLSDFTDHVLLQCAFAMGSGANMKIHVAALGALHTHLKKRFKDLLEAPKDEENPNDPGPGSPRWKLVSLFLLSDCADIGRLAATAALYRLSPIIEEKDLKPAYNKVSQLHASQSPGDFCPFWP